MSFDIFFQSFRYTGEQTRQVNPFTGQAQLAPEVELLNGAELQAIRDLFQRAGAAEAEGDDGDECYVLQLPDGGGAEVFSSGLETGCNVSVRELSSDIVKFLFDLLHAANWVMTPVMENPPLVTASLEAFQPQPEDMSDVVVCESAEELGVLLAKGFSEAQSFEEQFDDEEFDDEEFDDDMLDDEQ